MEEQLKYCRVCFATDVKMFKLDTTDLIGEIYSNLLEIPVYKENDHQHACFECSTLLLKYERFKSKCLESHNILSKIEHIGKKVSKQVLNNIHIEPSKFDTNLMFSPIVVDSYDSTPNEYTFDMKKNEANNILIKPETLDYETFDGTVPNDIQDDDDLEELPLNMLKSRSIKLSTTTKQIQTNMKIENSNTDSGTVVLNHVNASMADKTKLKVAKKKPVRQSNITKRKRTVDVSDDPPKKMRRTTRYQGLLESTEDFTVVWLTPDDARKDLLQRKETDNYKKSPHKCDFCFLGYECLKPFQNHMEKHSESHGEHKCEFCQIRFPKKYLLRNHILCRHERRFNCNHCSYVSSYTQQAQDHAKSHKTKFSCKVCGKLYGAPHSLITHTKTRHPEYVTETICELCGNIYFSALGLIMHKKRVHPQETNDKQGPECKICGVHFASEAAWKLHLVLSSKHETSNGCKMCGERFPTAACLREHMRTHERRRKRQYDRPVVHHRKITCRECGEHFNRLRLYRQHVKTAHPEQASALLHREEEHVVAGNYVCEICGKMFDNVSTLGYHFRKHTGERPFSCAECGKRFFTRAQLLAHATVHTGRDACACAQCGKRFSNKSGLMKHNKAVHLNYRPHKCLICDKRFVHKCDMQAHIKYYHDKVPYPKKKTAAA